MSDWITAPPTGLETAVEDFKRTLPGWWYSTGECHVSCDASCGPDHTGPASYLLFDEPFSRLFDNGFHVDLPQPSSLEAALRHVMALALAAIADPKAAYREWEDILPPELVERYRNEIEKSS